MATKILTDAAIRKLRPSAKPYRVSDGGLLYLAVMPSGAKSWQFRYRSKVFDATTKQERATQPTISFGMFPDLSLAAAREKAEEARALLAKGIDPIKHGEAQAAAAASNGTFREAFELWSADQFKKVAKKTAEQKIDRVEKFLLPDLGAMPMLEIDRASVIDVLRKLEKAGRLEYVKRAKIYGAEIFRRAMDAQPKSTPHDKRISNPFSDLRGTFAAPKKKSHPAITTAKELAPFLRKLYAYPGAWLTSCALKLSSMIPSRPGEVRTMEWAHVDLDAAEWRYGISKTDTDHLVPLSTQAVAILREVRGDGRSGQYVFPNQQAGKPNAKEPYMSENTINQAIRRLGYAGQHTAHGFRATARSLLAELGWNVDAIERQLGHKAAGPLGEAYARAQFLSERRKMMQAWADYLDGLRTGAAVVPIRRSGAA